MKTIFVKWPFLLLVLSGLSFTSPASAQDWYSACWAESVETGEVLCLGPTPDYLEMDYCRDFAREQFTGLGNFRFGVLRDTDDLRLQEKLLDRDCEFPEDGFIM